MNFLRFGIVSMASICCASSAAELAATLQDTALPVANQLIVSPDGGGKIQLLPIENIRADIDVFESHRALLFTSGSLVPYVGYAAEQGNLANIGSWTGSSRYAVMFTGQHNQQYMALIYPEGAALKGAQIDLAPVWEYGRKILPWDEKAIDHDSILEVIPGEGDSVTCLYWRTSSGRALAVVVTVKVKDPQKPTDLTFEFGNKREQEWPTQVWHLPTLAELGVK